MLVVTTSASWHIAKLGYSRLKRSTGKLGKIVRGLQENKTHLQKESQCVFVEKTALQNSFMKQEIVLYINDTRT